MEFGGFHEKFKTCDKKNFDFGKVTDRVLRNCVTGEIYMEA